MRIALTHDYLREYGGAERVLEALHELYPEAPVFVAFVDRQAMGIHWDKFADWDIRESWITKIPFYKKLFSPLRVLAPQFFGSFDMSDYDVIISSSNMYFAKAIKKSKDAVHISYCHTPPRALYGYNTMTDWKKNPIIRVVGTLINHYLRVVDYYVSQKVDVFVANSQEVQRRIKKFYRRESVVIYPPVGGSISDNGLWITNKDSHSSKPKAQSYYLYIGRLAYAKHPELAVQVANKLGFNLKLAGTGGMFDKLQDIAGDTVELLGSVTDEELDDLYRGAKALLYPVEDEDFGIVPVEAMMHGVPVIAHYSGGPKETVIGQNVKVQSSNVKSMSKSKVQTGVFFSELTVDGLVGAIREFEEMKFDRSAIAEYAERFSKSRFLGEVDKLVSSEVGK